MYAHQVIEDFLSVDNPRVVDHARGLADKIKNAVHFDFGDVSYLFDIMPRALQTFSPQGLNILDYMQVGFKLSSHINHLPFRVCTFSMHGNGPKLFYIVEEEVEGAVLNIQPVRLHKEVGFWLPSMATWMVDLIDNSQRFFPTTCFFDESETYKKELASTTDIDGSLMAIVRTCVVLLNTKNIGTIDNEPPAKLNKSRVKKGKLPIFTYKTLVIRPTSKRQQGLKDQGLWENRIHLCRGHFKEYTEDKPLFGRFTGRYWWQPSVRGRNTQGIVVKDYEVKGDMT